LFYLRNLGSVCPFVVFVYDYCGVISISIHYFQRKTMKRFCFVSGSSPSYAPFLLKISAIIMQMRCRVSSNLHCLVSLFMQVVWSKQGSCMVNLKNFRMLSIIFFLMILFLYLAILSCTIVFATKYSHVLVISPSAYTYKNALGQIVFCQIKEIRLDRDDKYRDVGGYSIFLFFGV